MELTELEKRELFQVEGDSKIKILDELHMTARYTSDNKQRVALLSLTEKIRILSEQECMDLVKDIQKNYKLPYPPRTIGERIADATATEDEYEEIVRTIRRDLVFSEYGQEIENLIQYIPNTVDRCCLEREGFLERVNLLFLNTGEMYGLDPPGGAERACRTAEVG